MRRLAVLTALVAIAACPRDRARDAERAPAAVRVDGALALGYRATATSPADAAVTRAQAAAARAPAQPGPYVDLATAFIQRSRWSRDPALLVYADDALAAARARHATGTAVGVASICLLSEQHRFAEARDAARALVAAAPDDPTGHLLLGDAQLELGAYDAAGDAYQRAIDLRPELRSYERAAHLRWLDGDVDGALGLLGSALESSSPRDPEPAAWCYAQLGGILWLRGQLDGAEAAAARARALVPDYPAAQLLTARLALARGAADDALAAVDRIPARIRTVEELALRADVLAALGRDAAPTVDEIGRRRRADPREVARFWARRGLARDEARALAERVVRERPTVDALAVEALADARAGRIDAARRALGQARRLGTRDPRLPLYGAVVELAAGDRAAARRLLDEDAPAARAVDPSLVAAVERDLAALPTARTAQRVGGR